MAKSHSVDEPRSANAVERTKRQRQPKATLRSNYLRFVDFTLPVSGFMK